MTLPLRAAPVVALIRPPLARLLRAPRTLLVAGSWCVLAVAVALIARSSSSSHPTDNVLLGAFAPLVLPLLAYVLTGAVVGSRALSASVVPLVSFGATPVRAAMAAVVVAVVACAATSSLLAGAMTVLSHGSTDPPLGGDFIASAYGGAAGGAAYAAWFTMGASIGRRGGGRAALLVVDWVLGAGDGASALASPRAHVRNLLGGRPPMQLSERESAVVLAALALACGLIAVRRAHRRIGG
jgi:hypothetical protein